MSQRAVEVIVGRLVTDEAFRQRFCASARATLRELVADGTELSAVEREALERLDPKSLQAFAESLDPRLQKALLSASEVLG